MNRIQKIGVITLAIGIAGWVTVAATGDAAAPKPSYEYWVSHGQAGVVTKAMQTRLNQGFEVDRLEVAAGGPGYPEANVVVVLKRQK